MSYNNTCKIRLVLWKACEGMKPITLSHRASWEKGEAKHRCHILSHIFPCTWGGKKKRHWQRMFAGVVGALMFSCFSLFLREKFPICLMKKKKTQPKNQEPKTFVEKFCGKTMFTAIFAKSKPQVSDHFSEVAFSINRCLVGICPSQWTHSEWTPKKAHNVCST